MGDRSEPQETGIQPGGKEKCAFGSSQAKPSAPSGEDLGPNPDSGAGLIGRERGQIQAEKESMVCIKSLGD